MIYKAVRFPECVPEYDHERKEDTIVPICTYLHRPESGTDYSITGQELLVSLCNLYKKINAPDYSVGITDMVWDWCRNNIQPYNIEILCQMMEQENYGDYLLSGEITSMACGEYFVRHSSRQRYCNNPKCQAERNNRKARAYYKRRKMFDN